LRQQFAIDLLDQAGAADEAAEEAGDDGEGDGEGEDGGALVDTAAASADEADPEGAAFAEPNEETAKVLADGEVPCDATGGPHLET
jgi:hypothetical protein